MLPGSKGWQAGRVRLRLAVEVDFEPDDGGSESQGGSPLDDLRESEG
ncbi:KGK domain-containing protein [Synechococcus sp. WC10meta]